MRYIIKSGPPLKYVEWISNFTRSRRKSPEYKEIPQHLKVEIKEEFIKEQKGLCCYCCGRVNEKTSHIEHFYPRYLCKTENRKKQTDYNNMFVSCNGFIEDISEYEKEFCGHFKLEWYDENKIISPLDNQCETYFNYTLQGKMKSSGNNDKAETMIEKLGLNEYSLKEARKKALEAIGYFEEDFDKEAALEIATQEDEDGYLPSFCNIIKYFACK